MSASSAFMNQLQGARLVKTRHVVAWHLQLSMFVQVSRQAVIGSFGAVTA